MEKHASGASHGKIILMGEHSVVYGEPAIALPFTAVNISAQTTYAEGPITLSSQLYQGVLDQAPDSLSNLKTLIPQICQELNRPASDLHITIQSTIPPGRGLGSSAAVAGAVIRSLYNFFEEDLDEASLLRLMDDSENIAHGNPSGLDVRTTSSNHPVYYQKGQGMHHFPVSLDAYLIVGDTGVIGDTLTAVSDVKKLVKTMPETSKRAIKRLGRLAKKTKQALSENHAQEIGRYMTKAHNYLKELEVSNPSLDRLIETALDSGAFGAKLTGGGRGGCMIALAENEDQAVIIAEALQKAGAANTWIYSLETGE